MAQKKSERNGKNVALMSEYEKGIIRNLRKEGNVRSRHQICRKKKLDKLSVKEKQKFLKRDADRSAARRLNKKAEKSE